MRISDAVLAVVSACCLTQTTWAHPGHAAEAGSTNGLLHYVTHPDHLSQLVIVAGCIGLVVILARSARRLSPAYAKVRKHP